MQETEAYFGAWVMIASAFLLGGAIMWSTHAAMRGGLQPNPAAGIRISSTLRDGNAWRAGHEAAWPVVRVVGAASIVLGLIGILLVLLGQPLVAVGVACVPVVLVLASLVPTIRRARAAAEAAPLGD